MTIKFRDLRHAFTTTPPLESLLGGRLARADRVRSVHSQLDCLLGNDRNVVARVGLHGAEAFQILSVNPINALLQVYPQRSVYRTVARVPAFTLLPGHYLRLSALISPSGMTNKLGGPLWTGDGAYGEIAAAVTWGGPSADTTTHKIILPASIETFGAEAALSSPRKRPIARVHPPFHQRHGAALDADVAHTGQVVERRNAGRTRVAGTLRAGDEDVHNDLCADRAHPHGAQRHRLLQGMTPV